MGFKQDLALYTAGDKLCHLMFGEIKKLETPIEGIRVIEEGLGVAATIDFLIRSSRNHDLLSEFFSIIPSLSAIHDFMENMPIAKVTGEEFERLVKMGHVL